jgi:hypothetical protein
MAIIRSKIARQLLAEGGAPRKGFKRGSTGFEGSPEIGASKTDTSSFGPVDTGDFGSESENIKQNLAARGIDRNQDTFMGSEDIQLRRNLPTAFNLATGAVISPMALTIDFLNRRRIAEEEEKDKGIIAAQLTGSPVFDYNVRMYNPETKRYDKTPRTTRFNDREEGGDSQEPIRLRQPIAEKIEAEPREGTFDDILKFYGAKFEDGGDVRQEYGLGSIVKKATRAVKKVVKSPIGKAALIGAFTFGIPGVQTGFFSKGLMGTQKGLGFKKFLSDKILGKQFVDTGGEVFRFGGISPLTAILGTSLASGLFSKQQEDEDETLPAAVRSDPEIRKALEYRGLAFAQGGEVEDEMLNLGGKEMDLRGGGFVPLGEYEKKDDVPARLSKNEFVFTADAVRAAGGGSVDKGADVMYKTMKTLENKVA